jgi:electron transfer flavoprotein alpha subunit/quercetin dioxygenase-like cupin family protein
MDSRAIWILGDLRSNRTWEDSLVIMAKAEPLAQAAGASRTMLLLGTDGTDADENDKVDLTPCISMRTAAEQAACRGADHVMIVDHAALAIPRTDAVASALQQLVAVRQPWLVLMVLNDFGRETAAFCAQRCSAGMIADCEELVLQDGRVVGRCPAWGGDVIADITLADGWSSALVTMQPAGGSLPLETTTTAEMERVTLSQFDVPAGLALKGRMVEAEGGRRLEEAQTVVVGGAGLGDIRGFGLVRELSASLGGEVGATRPPVLNHWVEEERLIGQTGKTVRPRLLISAATSGAVQYTAGISEAETIVAINRDPTAAIFQSADIGIVADAAAFLPLLINRAKQIAMRRMADAACALGGDEGGTGGGFGDLVRQLREARQWSPEELAQRTGQTPDFIQQVESDRMSPPVAFILRMAQAMEVDPSAFLSREEQAAIRDRRAQAYYQRTQNYSYTTLTPEAENSHLRAFMVTIEPHLAHKPVAYKHEGEEFIFVIQGELEFTLGSKVTTLRQGESIHFNSDVPHKLKNLSSEPTRCLVVLYTI